MCLVINYIFNIFSQLNATFSYDPFYVHLRRVIDWTATIYRGSCKALFFVVIFMGGESSILGGNILASELAKPCEATRETYK